MSKLVLALVMVALAACSAGGGAGSGDTHPSTVASASRSASPSAPPSASSVPKAAAQVAISGVTRLTGAAYMGRKASPMDGCPTGAKKCFDLENEIDGVGSAYFRGYFGNPTAAALCLFYTVRDALGWRFLDMTCSPPESGGPPGPDVGEPDVVANTLGTCANVRQSPGLASKVIGCLRTGTDVTIDGGPVYVVEAIPGHSHLWWHLSGQGWMAYDYLIAIWVPS